MTSKFLKIEEINDLQYLKINNPLAEATVSLQGAHVSWWRPKSTSEDVLWLSTNARYEKGRSIRGGVPIVWPWFGQHPTNNSYCVHGFARVIPWELTKSEDLKNGVTKLYLKMKPTDEVKKQLTYNFTLELIITIGESLSLSLTTKNESLFPFTISEGFHTYFYISDIQNIKIQGLESAVFADKVTNFNKGIEADDILFSEQEFDKVYLNNSNDCYIQDEEFNRVITVKKSNSGSTVIWAPGEEKVKKMSDMGGENEWRRMVCVESVNALENNVVIYPGKSHTIGTEIGVQEY
jgi:glucose-6-phosphate 1-epimerase